MEIIDEEGRLFGAVNVVDALVVLLVLAVGLAGFALVVGGGGPPGPMETRYATLDLGSQPEYVMEQVDVGDTSSLDDRAGNITITDTYVTTDGEGTDALARVAITQRPRDGSFRIDGAPLRLGSTVPFVNESYAVNTTVQNVGGEATFDTQRRTVVLRGSVPDAVAADVSAGDEVQVGDSSVATVEDAIAYDAGREGQRTLYLAASLRTLSVGNETRFGNTRLAAGETISFPLAGYRFNGTIARVGTGLNRTTRPLLVTSTVSAQTARDIEQGDAYRVAGRTVATVENVAVYGTDEPNRKRVYVGLSAETLGYGDDPQFGPQTLRTGVTLALQTSDYALQGEVVRVGALTQPGEVTTRTVTLQLRNVRPERANSVREGLSETYGGETIARVTDVQVEPAIVTLTSESGQIYRREHPVNKTVTLAVELQVRDSETGLLFKGRQLQTGNTVTLDLGTTTVTATVAELDAP